MVTSGSASDVHAHEDEIGEDIQFSLSSMMRAVNKVLPTMSSVPNVVEFPGGSRLKYSDIPSKIVRGDTFSG